MNGSVILIDDDEDILELLSEYLLLEDFNIMGTGTDGLQAVNLYTKLKPDFVLMDIAMPNYDGLYGLEHIKKINSNASVIVLTGNSDKSITQKIMQLKPTMVLEKPYPVEKLVSLLKSIKNPIPS
ncbi:response regulator transcription factor [Nitrosarchaeum sp. AC2]|uniref:response regulator transcription factor n=1 Tax=Nitrosarchaeum sp. AC2 TaxID=2259673 RepID=UPI0015CA8B0C|nr:response regulator [Nitrosarchaeum sp. AC2]QLH11079.1 response regulator [Nitrosarchaeum sp. AC2]